MNLKWHFNPLRPGDRVRNPANDSFFDKESLSTMGEALVREGIQNSLDAAQCNGDGIRNIRVQIELRKNSSADINNFLKECFDPVIEHFKKGIPNWEELQEGHLVFEDFNTTGLVGDINAWEIADENVKNPFFSFFRAEGVSSKTGSERGRHGIGKYVFPKASQIKSIFGLTARSGETPETVLLGTSILKNHRVDNQSYQPDAWFGHRDETGGLVNAVTDVTDREFLDKFSSMFELERGRSPGLSVVIPYIDPQIEIAHIRLGVIKNYFWPILTGALEVNLKWDGGKCQINADTLVQQLEGLDEKNKNLIALAEWASISKPCDEITILSSPVNERGGTPPQWERVNIPSEVLDRVRSGLEHDGKVALKVPVVIRQKDKSQDSYFKIYLESCRETGGKPLFIRDGIVITEAIIKGGRLSGFRSLVAVDDAPLAGLLGDSENVSHTEWEGRSERIKKYINGKNIINFVRRSVEEIVSKLYSEDKKGDATLLEEIFSVPLPSHERKNKERDKTSEPNPIPPPKKPKTFSLTMLERECGFHIKKGEIPFENLPATLKVQFAYDVSRGNPIKLWSKEDFEFGRSPLRHEWDKNAISIQSQTGNSIELVIKQSDFSFQLVGFDKHRDLVVRVNEINQSLHEEII